MTGAQAWTPARTGFLHGLLHGLLPHWRVAAFAFAAVGPFVPSLLAMRSFFLADNALGFVPFVGPIAAFALWQRLHPASMPGKRDVLVDALIAIPFVLGALYVLGIAPRHMGWYFWLYRVDLLALPLFAIAAALTFLGYQRTLIAWPGFALLLLLWPYPLVRLQQALLRPFLDLTTWLVATAVAFLRLPYIQDPTSLQTFTSNHLAPAENFDLVIGQLCSGTVTLIAFGLFVIAGLAFTRGGTAAFLRWAVLGLVLAFVANFLRVIALLVAATLNEHVAIDIVHPVLGIVLFVLLIALMLRLMGPFGLSLHLRRAGTVPAWKSAGAGGGRPLLALGVTAIAAAVWLGALDVRAQDYAFVGLGEGAPAVDITSEHAILPPVPGWALEHQARIGWTDLFGHTSRGDVFLYAVPDGPGVVVQTLVSARKSTLDRYPLERCVVFHGGHIDSIRRVSLPRGVTAVLVRSTDEDLSGSTLYWQVPVQVNSEIWHARVVLYLDVEEPQQALPARPEVIALADALGATLDARGGGGTVAERRAGVDLQLAALAADIIEQMLAGGGPGSSTPPAPAPTSG